MVKNAALKLNELCKDENHIISRVHLTKVCQKLSWNRCDADLILGSCEFFVPFDGGKKTGALQQTDKGISFSFQIRTPGVNFTIILRAAFTRKDPKSAKKTVNSCSFFWFWDLSALKAGCKQVDEIDSSFDYYSITAAALVWFLKGRKRQKWR